MRKILSVLSILAVSLFVMGGQVEAASKTKIAWSHYTGWEPFGVMQSSGILARYAEQFGVDVEMVFVGDYVDSITLYTSKQFNGVAATNMDILAIAGVGGRKSTTLIVGDYSDGNDGVVLKGVPSLKSVKGKKVNLVEYSVSHYLLARCLSKHGLSINDVTIVNTTDADIPAVVQSSSSAVAVSWNPMLMTIQNQKGVTVPCTSAEFPGEIIDMLLVGDEVPVGARKAIVAAWYELMARIKAGDKDIIKALAEQAESSVSDFNAQLKTTKMFYTPAEAVAFTSSKDLPAIMKSVIGFSFEAGVYDGVDSVGEIGVRFTDGSVMGDANNIMLNFDTTFMRMAADGRLNPMLKK